MVTKILIVDSQLTSEEENTVRTLQLLGDPTRFKICKLLLSNEELCVSEIAQRLNVSVSAVSQHFHSFELSGLVTKVRHGQKICYQLQTDNQIINQIVSSK